MLRLLARLALLIAVMLAALLLLIRLRGYDSSMVNHFFDDSCTPQPCWQGIRPGETTIDDALAILRGHPWVTQISEVYASPFQSSMHTALIYWTWSSSYPYFKRVPDGQQGIIITDQGIVRQIYLTTGISLGDMWLALGGASSGVVDYLPGKQSLRIDNTAHFAADGIAATVTTYADCWGSYPNMWQKPVNMWLIKGGSLDQGSRAYSPRSAEYPAMRASAC